MSLKDLNRRHLSLIGRYSTRYAIRGGTGLIFLMLVMALGLLVAHIVMMPVELAQQQAKLERGEDIDKEELVGVIVKVAKPYVAWAIGERDAPPTGLEMESADPWATYLLEERPALLSAVLLVLLFMLPYLCVFGSFNQYSGDIGSRGIRFQLLRTERANIYFGRFIGTVFYFSLTLALLIVTIILYMGLKLKFYGWGDLIVWGGWGWIALSILAIPYVAVCGWVSSMIDHPFGALVLCALAVLGVPTFALVAGLTWEHAHYIKYALPWGSQNNLLHHSAGHMAGGVAACFGYAGVFLTVGYRHFAKRDL